MERKYEFTGEVKRVEAWGEHYVKRIRAVRKILYAAPGDIGGWIESERNLSHDGNCWVSDDAMILGGAVVCEDALVWERACVEGYAVISGKATIKNNALVSCHARIYDSAIVYGRAWIQGEAQIYGLARVEGDVSVKGPARICGHTFLHSTEKIGGNGRLNSSDDCIHISAAPDFGPPLTFYRGPGGEIFVSDDHEELSISDFVDRCRIGRDGKRDLFRLESSQYIQKVFAMTE